MTGFPILLAVGFLLNLTAILFVISCVVLILIVLVQKGKGGGLSSAFGGGMASGILGSKTGDFLTWVTIVTVGIMLTLATVLGMYYKPSPGGTPGATSTTQSQQPPTAPSQESAPEPNVSVRTINDINNLSLPAEIPVNEEQNPLPADSGGNEDANMNESSDTNQPGN